MSDDTFIREVNEQMRQERLHRFWSRFGRFVIAAVVIAILATVGYVLWERNQASRAAADGDRYYAAVDLAAAGDTQGAVAAFEDLASNGVGAYPYLARLRIASTLAGSGDWSGAVARLDEVAASSAPQPLRDVAAVRAAYLLVDHGTPDEVRERVERLTNEAEPLRHPAREALGLALWKAGDGEAARPFFQQITEDLSAPAGISQRAELLLGIIDAGTTIPEPGASAPAEAPASPLPPSLLTPAPESVAAPEEPAPADAPAAPAAADPTLETPLAEQLDLPDPASPAPMAPPADPAPAVDPAPAAPAAPAGTPPS